MTKEQAVYLAAQSPDADYVARKIRGQWCVWSHEGAHIVSFDDDTIIKAALACTTRDGRWRKADIAPR